MTEIEEIYKKMNEITPIYRGVIETETGAICGIGCLIGCLGEGQDDDGETVRKVKDTLKWGALLTVYTLSLGN